MVCKSTPRHYCAEVRPRPLSSTLRVSDVHNRGSKCRGFPSYCHRVGCYRDLGRFGARLVYGGVVISMARALSFNGLANAFHIAAINGGRHVAPAFAGDTIYCWSEVIAKSTIPDRDDIGALQVRTVATKNLPCQSYPHKAEDGTYADGVLLDLDYWVVLPT